MNKKYHFWITTILAVGALWFLFHKPQVSILRQESLTNTTDVIAAAIPALISSSGAQTKPSVTNADPSATNNTNEIAWKYEHGLISKDGVMSAALLEQNKNSQDFYGKVIDQYGKPVANASVTGELVLNDGTYGGIQVKKFSATTDSDGLFEFAGIHGAGLGVTINKEGYKIGERGEGYQGPAGGKPSPNNRAIFTMWKLRGAEPLIGSGIDAHIPHDGTPVVFDMTTGKQSPNGDFRVILSQYPLEVKRGWDRFDWSVKVEILNGGMLEENDAYPFWAPESGYQPSFEFNESSNSVKWLGGLQKKFYIKTAQNQYGLIQFKIYPGRSPTGLEANFTINPSGSQNLETDNVK